MSDKVKYSILQNSNGNIAVQSTIRSFNLDHVTEKDIVSFYSAFSQYSAWDTGLLPVDGSGILSIRTAGTYTQFAYQHKPGLYHINWAASEGGTASSYYVAQPYRIIICDMKDGNLLGARMFYSPYPITHPSQHLYHVNLPNINCKGYRKNGVGWICLYQNEDWSNLPLNERIVRFIERCSGVETYNDANMSETDGTRFYRDRGMPIYTWDPIQWQEKSNNEGYEWTLDESLWIPVRVKSMDSQEEQYDSGINLTFADALVGDYRAYYYDDQTTKPINAIIRPDKELSPQDVLSWFVNSYNSSVTQSPVLLNNTFESSQKVKDDRGSLTFTGSTLTNAPENHQLSFDEHEYYTCNCCGEEYDQNEEEPNVDYYDNLNCPSCFNEYFVFLKTPASYFHIEDSNLVFDESSGNYYHLKFDTIQTCDNCDALWCRHGQDAKLEQIITLSGQETTICYDCIQDFAEKHDMKVSNCLTCSAPTIVGDINTGITKLINSYYYDYDNKDDDMSIKSEIKTVEICNKCVSSSNYIVCPCGVIKDSQDDMFGPCEQQLLSINSDHQVKVNACCTQCKLIDSDPENSANLLAFYNPTDKDSFIQYHKINLTNTVVSPIVLNNGFEYINKDFF